MFFIKTVAIFLQLSGQTTMVWYIFRYAEIKVKFVLIYFYR